MIATKPLQTMQEILAYYENLPVKELPGADWTKFVVSFGAITRRRNARKRGILVFLKYIPTAKFTEDLAVAPSASSEGLRNLYVGITLYNGVRMGRYHVSEVTHYLPMHALDSLFQLHNAIIEDCLFDHYMRKACIYPMPQYLLESFRQDFYESHKNRELFTHCIFEDFKEGEKEQEYSQLYLSYNGRTSAGHDSNTLFRLYCMKLPRKSRKRETGEEFDRGWNSCNLTEASVGLTKDQLIEMVEKIHQEICGWFESRTEKIRDESC